MASGEVCQVLHLQETNLVKAASKDVDHVSIVGSSFGKAVVELALSVTIPH